MRIWVSFIAIAVVNIFLAITVVVLSRGLHQAGAALREYSQKFADLSKEFKRLSEQAAQFRTANVDEYSVIHKRGDACPENWELLPAYFKSEDGTTRDACLNPKYDGGTHLSFDYLLAGEAASVGLDGGLPRSRKL